MNIPVYNEYETRNSPIEFVITGAAGYHDGVLIKSANCGLDLIGFSQSIGTDPKPYGDGPNLFSSSMPGRGQMQYVQSRPIQRGTKSGEARQSTYTFCWVGGASREAISEISEIFERQLADLERGVEEGSIRMIEWSIAPVIYKCSVASNMRKKRIKQRQLITSLYFVTIALATLVALIIPVLKYWQLHGH